MKHKRWNQILSRLLSFALVLSFFPTAVPTARAEHDTGISYLAWNDGTEKLETETYNGKYYSVTNSNESVAWEDGWYYVASDATIKGDVTLNGDVYLILGNSATLTVGGIAAAEKESASLTIYAQSKGETAGTLTVETKGDTAINAGTGTVTINGGKVNASGMIAGIGAGTVEISGGEVTASGMIAGVAADAVTISDGKVSASGTGAGIAADAVTINGGEVTANATGTGEAGSGILTLTVEINGGTVTASGAISGIQAGITVDGTTKDGTVTINGGTVNASGTMMGIYAKTVTISGDTVEATGTGEESAGIFASQSLKITGGEVTATASMGAAIGLGQEGQLTIEGLKIEAGTDADHAIAVAADDVSGKKYVHISALEPLAPVSYMNPTVDNETHAVTFSEANCNNYKVVTSAESATWNDGWYVVKDSNVVITGSVTLTGNVYLILADSAKLTVNGGIAPAKDGSASLTIYAQSTGTGKLEVSKTGGTDINADTVTINGGTVEATDTDQTGFVIEAGTVTINGGTVNATNKMRGISANTVTISGGTVTASGTNVGIFAAFSLKISDGTVTATGTGNMSSGISAGISGTVTISGGTVNATGETNGISGNVVVTGTGDLTATGGSGEPNGRGVTGTITCTVNGKSALESDDNETWENVNNGETSLARYIKVGNSVTLEAVSYMNPTVNNETHTVNFSEANCDNYKVVTSAESATWNDGWYVVKGSDVTITGDVALTGDVYLILADSTTLTVNGAIKSIGKNLTIYAQSTGENEGKTPGTLTVNKTTNGVAISVGTVTINGGTVNATCTGQGGNGISAITVTINGGTVNATCPNGGIQAGTVTINGGTVNAIDSNIGIGANTVTINGGKVTATGTEYGIYAASSLTIDNGTVNATGTGFESNSIYAPTVTISGGTLTATGTGDSSNGISGDVTVNNTGKLTATGGSGGKGVTGTITCTVQGKSALESDDDTDNKEWENVDNGGTSSARYIKVGTPVTPTAVKYLKPVEDTTTHAVTGFTEETTSEYKKVKSTTTTWATGWYYVLGEETVEITGDVTLNGDVKLILGDGATLNITGAISGSGQKLTIYAQSTGENEGENPGTLVVSKTDNGPAIGVGTGTVTINGGTVNATGKNIAISAGAVTINGGKVTASGEGQNGAGIFADITINGGTVKATGPDNGIQANTVMINGGKVNARGGYVGISAGTVTISGGTVTADSNETSGVGISAGTVTISGGKVTATGRSNGIDGNVVITGTGDLIATGDSGNGRGVTGTITCNVEGKSALESNNNTTWENVDDGETSLARYIKVGDRVPLTPVKYLNPVKDTTTNAVTGFTEGTTSDQYYKKVKSTTNKTWAAGWYYVVGESVEIDGSVTLTGDVNLILGDKATLIINGGIMGDMTLNIYAQSEGDNKGTLTVTGSDSTVGIDSNITVNGGTVTVTGGSGGDGVDGSVTVNGGELTVNGGSGGTGVYNGDVTVNGGKLTVTGGKGNKGGYGVFYHDVTVNGGTAEIKGGKGEGSNSTGGDGVWSGNVTVNGTGELTVTGGDGVSVGGHGVNDGNVTVNGTGKLTVTGGSSSGNNVTGGCGVYDGNVTVNGGTVTVTGGAANGTGGTGGTGVDGNVTVKDGTAEIKGGKGEGNAIFGGVGVESGNVTVKGGELKVTGGDGVTMGGIGVSGSSINYVKVSGGELTVTGGKGTYGGNGIVVDVTVTGGKVEIKGGEGTTEDGGAGVYGTVTVNGTGELTVTGGKGASNGGAGVMYIALGFESGNTPDAVTVTGGTATITGGKGAYGGAGVGSGNVTVSGTGKLTVTGGEGGEGTNNKGGAGVSGSYDNTVNVTVNGTGELTVTGGKGTYGGVGVGFGNVTVSGGKVEIKGGEGTTNKGGAGVSGSDDDKVNVTVENGELTITGGKGTNGGYGVNNGNVTVTDGKVEIKGGEGVTSYGGTGVLGTVKVENGELTITGGTGSGTDNGGTGVNGSVTVNDGELNVSGNYGVYLGGGKFTVTGGTVTVNGKTNDGINGDVKVTGGTLTAYTVNDSHSAISGTVTAKNMKTTAGASESEAVVVSAYDDQRWVRIEPGDITTAYILTIPAKLTVTNPGWNSLDAITAKINRTPGEDYEIFDATKALNVSVKSDNLWNLKSGDNAIGYNLVVRPDHPYDAVYHVGDAAYTINPSVALCGFSASELNSNDGVRQPIGIIVADYNGRATAGKYTDTVTFTAEVVSFKTMDIDTYYNGPEKTGTATIYYLEGETWEKAITKHQQENAEWKIVSGNVYWSWYRLNDGEEAPVGANSVIAGPANQYKLKLYLT